MSSRLTSYGLPTIVYHAGLSKADRESNQHDWSTGKYPIVAATISFGMGVDKANVRFVLHWTLPKSLGAYYQESGRAGRDGQMAHCRIYYSRRERDTVLFLTHKTSSQTSSRNKENSAQRKLDVDTMVDFVESVVCRHRQFADYFQDEPPACKDRCDVCVSSATVTSNLSAFRNLTWNRFIQPADEFHGPRDPDGKEEGCSASQMEENDRLGRQGLIEEEFRKRRNASSQGTVATSWLSAPENTRLVDPDNRRLAGITGRARDQTLQLLMEALKVHASPGLRTCAAPKKLGCDEDSLALVQMCAAAEFALFNESKVAAMYRTRMTRLITKLRRPETTPAEALETVQSKGGAVGYLLGTTETGVGKRMSTEPRVKLEPLDEQSSAVPQLIEPVNCRLQHGPLFSHSQEAKVDISAGQDMTSRLKIPTDSSIAERNDRRVVPESQSKSCSTVLKRENLGFSHPFKEGIKKMKSEQAHINSNTKPIASTSKDAMIEEPSYTNDEKSQAHKRQSSSITYFWERQETHSVGQTSKVNPMLATGPDPIIPAKNKQKSILRIDTNLDSSSSVEKHPSSSKRHGHSLSAAELAKVVVLALSPYFSKGRFGCKDTFKAIAKKLTQALYPRGWSADEAKPAVHKSVSELMKSVRSNLIADPSDIDWSVLAMTDHL